MRVVDLLGVVRQRIGGHARHADANSTTSTRRSGCGSTASRSRRRSRSSPARLRDEYGVRELRFRRARRAASPNSTWAGRARSSRSDALHALGDRADAGRRRADAAHAARRARAPRRRGLAPGRPGRRQRAWFRFLLPAGRAGGGRGARAARRRPKAGPSTTTSTCSARSGATRRAAGAPARRACLHGLRHRDHRAGAFGGRRDHQHRRGAHRQRAAAEERGVRAAGRPAAPLEPRIDAHPRHRRRGAGRASRRSSRCCPRSTAFARTRCWSRTTPPSTCAFSS